MRGLLNSRLTMVKKIEPVSGIYLISIIRPGRLPLYYVGQTIQMNRRMVYHRKTLKAGRHDNDHLQKAYNKYGIGSLLIEILELCSSAVIDDVEQWWLDEMHGHERVMNIAKNATSPNRGRTFGPETRAKVSKALQQRVVTDSARAATSLRMLGSIMSDEQKKKISNTKLARAGSYVKQIGARHHRSIPVEGTCIATGAVVSFESGGQAKAAGFDGSAVMKACRGIIPAFKGYRWRFSGDK